MEKNSSNSTLDVTRECSAREKNSINFDDRNLHSSIITIFLMGRCRRALLGCVRATRQLVNCNFLLADSAIEMFAESIKSIVSLVLLGSLLRSND